MPNYPFRHITYFPEGSMRNAFTVHCIPWEICAPLLEEFRLEASLRRVISHVDALPDPKDSEFRHAIAIDVHGRVIGAARLKSDGCVDRLAVMPHESHQKIMAALHELLSDFALSRYGVGKAES